MAFVSSNLTSGFIDLATFDELEKYMYGGPKAITYFVRETRKSTWFTQVPTVLSRCNGTPDFNQEWGSYITRAGDYLLSTWIRLDLPAVTFNANSTSTGLRWTRNLMHNLVKEVQITFNDLQAYRLDCFFLDFWAAFTTPAGKREGYENMIGNVGALTQPVAPGGILPAATLNLPLPVFYTRDSGVALPTAALPYNEMRIQVWFRDWTELLIVDNTNAAANPFTAPPSRPATLQDLSSGTPALSNVYIWANYAIVSNDERKRMGCAPRDILIEQVQTAAPQTFAPATNPNPSYDIRFSHAIKVLFFSVKNTTNRAQHSNYVNTSPLPGIDGGGNPIVNYIPPAPSASDPILNASLVYENTARLTTMGADYYSLIQPWYQPNAVIPFVTGFHMYSYSLDFLCCDPKGSTNYGKLTNVSIILAATQSSQLAAQVSAGQSSNLPLPTGLNATLPPAWVGHNWWLQNYQFIVVGVNNNVIRISGGSLGFPVL